MSQQDMTSRVTTTVRNLLQVCIDNNELENTQHNDFQNIQNKPHFDDFSYICINPFLSVKDFGFTNEPNTGGFIVPLLYQSLKY